MNYPNGAESFTEWLATVPSTVKATIGAVLLLVAIGFFLADYRDLPERVQSNEQSIGELRSFDGTLERTLQRQDRQLSRILCHLEEQRSDNPTWERCEQ